jgi:hypothetical protein
MEIEKLTGKNSPQEVTSVDPSEKAYNDYNHNSLDDFLQDLSKEREIFEPSGENNIITEEINQSENFKEKEATEEIKKKNKRVNDIAAKVIVKTIDKGIGFSCSLISMDSDESFNADEDDLQDLVQVWQEIMPENKTIPAWSQLLMLYPVIYGPIFKKAFDVRKLNKKIAELETKNIEQQEELMNLKFQNQKNEISKNKPTKEEKNSESNLSEDEITKQVLKLREDLVPISQIVEKLTIPYSKVRKIIKNSL